MRDGSSNDEGMGACVRVCRGDNSFERWTYVSGVYNNNESNFVLVIMRKAFTLVVNAEYC